MNSRFIVLDGLIEEGTIKEDVEKEGLFKCVTCGDVYTSTLHKVLNFYESKAKKGIYFTDVCPEGIHSCNEEVVDRNLKAYSNLYKRYIDSGKQTTVFASTCTDCGNKFYATKNTILRRGSLICEDCSKGKVFKLKNEEIYYSLLEQVPDIEQYWDKSNNMSPKDIHLSGSSREEFTVVCPLCKAVIKKQYRAILKSGTYCGPCAKRVNVRFEDSLLHLYPRTAKKYDNSKKNVLSSDKIHATANGKYWFHCDVCGGDYLKTLVNEVKAEKEGTLGCPICQGFEVRGGINDVLTKSPYGKIYWDYDKNTENPKDVYYDSRKTYWFKCLKGHSFDMSLFKLNCYYSNNKGKGNGCPICMGRRVVKGINDVATVFKGDLSRWSENSSVKPDEVTMGSSKLVTALCVNCGKEFTTTVYNYTHGAVCTCEDCRNKSYSVGEKEIVKFIRGLGFTVEENAPISGNRSIDIVVKEKGIALEYNGVYWHSTDVRPDVNFHKDRIYDVKNELGLRLYYIWEDDYHSNKKLIEDWLRNLLGVSIKEKVNARDCTIAYVERAVADAYLNSYHIQGSTPISNSIGLFKESELVALLSYSFDGDMIYIKRYCTSCNVRGGFSKLLKQLKNIEGFKGIYTFSDNCISDGNLYKSCGFTLEKELRPDYMYVVGSKRVHKFNFRKEYFRTCSDLEYDSNLSETQLALLNGLNRVYDAGKKKWVLYFRVK